MLRPFRPVAARQSLVLTFEFAQQIGLARGRVRGDLPSIVRSARGAGVLPREMLLQAGLNGDAFAAGVAVTWVLGESARRVAADD